MASFIPGTSVEIAAPPPRGRIRHALFDFDGTISYVRDGWQDFYVTNSGEGSRNRLYRNQGDGTFTDVAAEVGVADVNRPGTGVSMGAVWVLLLPAIAVLLRGGYGVQVSSKTAPADPLVPSGIVMAFLSSRLATTGIAPIFLVMPLPSPVAPWQGRQEML